MAKQTRLSAEQRRHSIIAAALPLFARQGFNGTTTKQLAEAANISEALLYRHFPSKELLYNEIQGCMCSKSHRYSEIIKELNPSTSTLVNSVHFLVSVIFIGDDHHCGSDAGAPHPKPNADAYICHLLVQSLLEDGHFARMFWNMHLDLWTEKWTQCVEASIAAGDMVDTGVAPTMRWWFTHHIAMTLRLIHLPAQPAVEYGFDRAQILDQAVRFALRGFGLKDEAIRAHYNPAMLKLFTDRLFSNLH